MTLGAKSPKRMLRIIGWNWKDGVQVTVKARRVNVLLHVLLFKQLGKCENHLFLTNPASWALSHVKTHLGGQVQFVICILHFQWGCKKAMLSFLVSRKTIPKIECKCMRFFINSRLHPIKLAFCMVTDNSEYYQTSFLFLATRYDAMSFYAHSNAERQWPRISSWERTVEPILFN